MPIEHKKNCWEIIDCPVIARENCMAHKLNSCTECWLVVDPNKGCPPAAQYGNCWSCPVYLQGSVKVK